MSHATIIWIPFGSTRYILECYLSYLSVSPPNLPLNPHTHLTSPTQKLPKWHLHWGVMFKVGWRGGVLYSWFEAPVCETSKTHFEPWSIVFFNLFLKSQSPFSILHLCPLPPSLSKTIKPNPLPLCVLYSMSACPYFTVCLPVSLCLLVCCLAAWVCFVLPRVLSLVSCLSCPVFPVLSICLSLSQLFHLVDHFLLPHWQYIASLSLIYCIPTNILTLNRCRYFGFSVC